MTCINILFYQGNCKGIVLWIDGHHLSIRDVTAAVKTLKVKPNIRMANDKRHVGVEF